MQTARTIADIAAVEPRYRNIAASNPRQLNTGGFAKFQRQKVALRFAMRVPRRGKAAMHRARLGHLQRHVPRRRQRLKRATVSRTRERATGRVWRARARSFPTTRIPTRSARRRYSRGSFSRATSRAAGISPHFVRNRRSWRADASQRCHPSVATGMGSSPRHRPPRMPSMRSSGAPSRSHQLAVTYTADAELARHAVVGLSGANELNDVIAA